jgi:hypothetical protein
MERLVWMVVPVTLAVAACTSTGAMKVGKAQPFPVGRAAFVPTLKSQACPGDTNSKKNGANCKVEMREPA